MSGGDFDLRAAVDRTREEVIGWRREFHRHPELSMRENATAERLTRRCEELGYAVRADLGGGTGLIADLDSGRPGPTVMLRADIDALPILERGTERPVTSEQPGVMHACGHDGHMAMALGAASVLANAREGWSGRVRLCFQPAEETAEGGLLMLADGVLQGVDRVFGIHLWSPIDVGRVAVREGAMFGSADDFGITVRGRGGHGGMPHTAVDPVVVAAQVVVALQSIVSRETSPFDPAVVTVGRIEGGTAFNVIAEEVRLRGTVRALAETERTRILNRVQEISEWVARAARAEAIFERGHGTPPVVSEAESAALVRLAAVATVGEEHVDQAPQITVGDDIAYYLEQVPGCYFLVGAGFRGRENAPHHHPEFDIDEACLPIGVETLARSALAVLQSQ